MKKIININLSSRLIPIEDSAYETLKSYIDHLKRHFDREEGGDEIVSDIENRIAELFQEKLKKGAHCITDEDVAVMIDTMGRPEQLDKETVAEPQEKAEPQMETPPAGRVRRLTRNENDKVWGGVCSGVAAYLGIDPLIIRILTVLLVLAWGFGLIIYIVLWAALPASPGLRSQKRLYRNPDNKVIGGVASGIAAYYNIDPVVPRIIFCFPLLSLIFTSIFRHPFGIPGIFFELSLGSLPTLVLLYLVLWISVPKARTVAEKLEMRGEKVDVQSIANAVKGPGEEKKTELADESLPSAAEPALENPPPSYPHEPPRGSGCRRFIVTAFRVCIYIILAIVVISVCIALAGVAGGFIGAAGTSSLLLPYRHLLIQGTTQQILAWPAVLLTVGIPVVAIMWLILKLLTGFRPKSRMVGVSLFCLWIAGVICAVWLTALLVSDFSMRYQEKDAVRLQQPVNGGLMLTAKPSNVSIGGWDMLGDFIELGDDTVIIKAISLKMLQSPDDSFHIDIQRCANGSSFREARTFARSINFSISQQDSIVYIPDGFALSSGMPYRKQHVVLRVYVPEGGRILISESLRKRRHFRHWSSDDWMDDDLTDAIDDWKWGKEYYMGMKDLKVDSVIDKRKKPKRIEKDSGKKPGKIYRYEGPDAQPADTEPESGPAA